VNARILTWGYDSKVSRFFSGAANQSNIADYARNMLHGLKAERLKCVSVSYFQDHLLKHLYSMAGALYS